MVAIELKRKVCHTEVIEDDCGLRLVDACHDAPRSLKLNDAYICAGDEFGNICEEIDPVLRRDDFGCLCC